MIDDITYFLPFYNEINDSDFNLNIYKKKDDSKVAYAQNVKNAKNIREALLTKIRTQEETVDIYHKFHFELN